MIVCTAAEMRALEAAAESIGLPGPALMEIAGRAGADAIVSIWTPIEGRRIVVLVGPGNNGGDGLVTARWLNRQKARVIVVTVNRRAISDAKIDLLLETGVPIFRIDDGWSEAQIRGLIEGSNLIVDALLGIGNNRAIVGAMASILKVVNALHIPIVALDTPSGLNADTGDCDAHTPRAVITLSLGAVKRGLVLGLGASRSGLVVPIDIAIPRAMESKSSPRWLSGRALVDLLPRRDRMGHKGTNGNVLVIAGSDRYPGAPILAARGAARVGAGLVTLAAPAGVQAASAGNMVEVTLLPLPDATEKIDARSLRPILEILPAYKAVVIGPGLGQNAETSRFLLDLLAAMSEMKQLHSVLDADALNILAKIPNWWKSLPAESILTPHPLEMARLLKAKSIDSDRISVAAQAAEAWNAHVVLKGAYSIIASPTGAVAVCPAANSVLAAAGTGDVLSGAIGGLLAQGISPGSAAIGGVVVHAAAGEIARWVHGEGGILASEIADLIPQAMRDIQSGNDPWDLSGVRGLIRREQTSV